MPCNTEPVVFVFYIYKDAVELELIGRSNLEE